MQRTAERWNCLAPFVLFFPIDDRMDVIGE